MATTQCQYALGKWYVSNNHIVGYPEVTANNWLGVDDGKRLYEPLSAPWDSAGDDMPDAWESKFGLDLKDPIDNKQDKDGNGYTNLE